MADTPSIIDTKANSEPMGVGTPEKVNNSSIGGGGPDVSVRPRAELTKVKRQWRHDFSCARREGSAGSSGRRPFQLARLEDARMEMFADYTPSTALVFSCQKVGLEIARDNSVFRGCRGRICGCSCRYPDEATLNLSAELS